VERAGELRWDGWSSASFSGREKAEGNADAFPFIGAKVQRTYIFVGF
jgi:hypothetical protein